MYFVHLIGVVYNSGFANKFQVLQEHPARIRVKMILEPGITPWQPQPNLERISGKIRLLMGDESVVLYYEFVDSIPLTESGKHQYVIRKFPVKAAELG